MGGHENQAKEKLDVGAANVAAVEVKQEGKFSVFGDDGVVLAVRAAILLAAAFLLWQIAWMSDDAVITLRHALNLTHGWGAGYNATESVQAYTHPAWFLLWVAAGSLTGEWLITITIVSIVLTVAAVALVLWKSKSVAVLLAAGSVLLLSNAFTEFAVSGLENPLSYLLVGVVLTLTLRENAKLMRNAAFLGVAVAAVGLTRLDLLVLVAPAVALWGWGNRDNLKQLAVFGGAFLAPFVAWHTWGYSTYGSLLPNTYAAKRNVDISFAELAQRGGEYLLVSLSRDLFTTIALVVGLLLVLPLGSPKVRVATLGVLAYLTYVALIGGDFMSGRFLAVPVYAMVLLSVLAVEEKNFLWVKAKATHYESGKAAVLTVVALAILLHVSTVMGFSPTVISQPESQRWWWGYEKQRIADERGVYMGQDMGIRSLLQDGESPQKISLRGLRDAIDAYETNTTGERLRVPADVIPNSDVCGGLGYSGVLHGPKIHVLDECGLSDAFLARKVHTPTGAWRMAHFNRAIPEGYIDALRTGDASKVKDPSESERLRELWENIR